MSLDMYWPRMSGLWTTRINTDQNINHNPCDIQRGPYTAVSSRLIWLKEYKEFNKKSKSFQTTIFLQLHVYILCLHADGSLVLHCALKY